MFLIILRLIATFSKSESNYLSCENKMRKREKQAEIRADLMSCLLSGSLLIANTTTMIKDVPHSRSTSPAKGTRMCPLPRRLFRGGVFHNLIGCHFILRLQLGKNSRGKQKESRKTSKSESCWRRGTLNLHPYAVKMGSPVLEHFPVVWWPFRTASLGCVYREGCDKVFKELNIKLKVMLLQCSFECQGHKESTFLEHSLEWVFSVTETHGVCCLSLSPSVKMTPGEEAII